MALPPVALLGLGLMGGGMARRLLHAGYPLSVYNRTRAKADPLAADGARVAATPREAAAGAAVIISMLADDEVSRAAWLGADGALAGAAPGSILIESSTVTVAWVRALAAAAGPDRGFLDAPVTGSKPQAASGELCFLVGGDAATLERVRPVLAAMSRAIVPLGPIGSGATVKLVNNFLCGVQAASLSEGLALLERSGVDLAKALEIITTGAPGSPLLKALSGRMTSRSYDPNFLLRLMAKDLRYAQQEAERHGLANTTAPAARQVFEAAAAAGFGEHDLSAIIEQFR